MLGITVCENDAFQYVYLVNKRRLLDFIGWHKGKFHDTNSDVFEEKLNLVGKNENQYKSILATPKMKSNIF